jgi:hypothetical protein
MSLNESIAEDTALVVSMHMHDLFAEDELAEDSVCSILEHTSGDGKTYSAKYYNLDASEKP